MSRTIFLPVLLLLCSVTVVGSADEKPKDTSEATLIGGRLVFVPPPADAWERATNITADDSAAYVARSEHGAIAIQVLPVDAEMTQQMGGAIIRALRDAHKKANQKILFGPKIEPDKRFALRVHEKYQDGEKSANEVHLYRNIGPRVVMVTVNAWNLEDAAAQAMHNAGEELLAAAKWVTTKKK